MTPKNCVVVPVEWFEELRELAEQLDTFDDQNKSIKENRLLDYIDSVDEILKQERISRES